MKTKKIAILCILESHSDDNQIECLNNKFNPLYKFMHTYDKDNTHSKGIVIVKNNNLIPNDLIDITNLVPGRAINVAAIWLKESQINILATYTPNPPRENEKFWNHLTKHFTQNNTIQPDIMLGDFNIVEEAIDWLPSHPDPLYAANALHKLKSTLEQVDSWCCTNTPPDHNFTFDQPSGGSQSRIDRIYMTETYSTAL